MNPSARQSVVRALRRTASVLTAGLVAYPPKMYESLAKRVDALFAGWALLAIEEVLLAKEAKLEVFQPKATTSFPPLALSPAVLKMARLAAPEVPKLFDEKGELTGYSRISHEYKEVHRTNSITSEFKVALAKIEKLSKDDLGNLSDYELHVLSMVLDVATSQFRSEAASKASRLATMYIRDRANFQKKLEEAKDGAASFKQVGWDAHDVDHLVRDIDAMKRTKAWFESLGAKAAERKNKRKKRIGPDEKVEWDEPIDLTGLPSKYPIKLPDDFKTIHVVVKPAKATFVGSWSPEEKRLTILIPGLEWTVEKNKRMMDESHETIQHELRHLVQNLMQLTLEQRQVNEGKPLSETGPHRRAGTPLSPRHPGTGALSKHDAEQMRRAYPTATDKELYFLGPVEFFPHISSAWRRFKHIAFMFRSEDEYTEDDILKRWKEHVGVLPVSSDIVDPFYAALKKHDKRLYKRALSEGVKFIRDYVAEKFKKPGPSSNRARG